MTDRDADRAVLQMRLVVTSPDYDLALAFYRDTLGLPELGAFRSDGGRARSSMRAGRRSS